MSKSSLYNNIIKRKKFTIANYSAPFATNLFVSRNEYIQPNMYSLNFHVIFNKVTKLPLFKYAKFLFLFVGSLNDKGLTQAQFNRIMNIKLMRGKEQVPSFFSLATYHQCPILKHSIRKITKVQSWEVSNHYISPFIFELLKFHTIKNMNFPTKLLKVILV